MYSTIYWITRLDKFSDASLVIAYILCIATMILIMLSFVYYDVFFVYCDVTEPNGAKVRAKFRKRAYLTGALTFVFGVLHALIPTKNEAILIFAGGKAYEYVQQDTSLKKIPGLATEYLKVVLEKEIKEAERAAK